MVPPGGYRFPYVNQIMRKFFNRFLPPVFIYSIIFYFSSLPAKNLPSGVPDYFFHPLEYMVLTFFFFRILPEPLTRKSIAWGLAILLLLALLDESHQYFVPGRLFSMKDILYDSLGIFIGLICRLALNRYTEAKGNSESA